MSTAGIFGRQPSSILEQFLRDHIDRIGGVWDEVEPQVYDVLLPSVADAAVACGEEPELLRLAFDPEALPEHPQSQLASLGTPLVDRLLRDAIDRGHGVELYRLGLNLQPRDLAQRIVRALVMPDGLSLEVVEARPLSFPQMIFWFEATFAGDQKEQEIVPLAIDLHYGRQVRHLGRLLEREQLVSHRPFLFPEVCGIGRAHAYMLARDQAVRTVKALANTRAREQRDHIERQAARMAKYYDDMATELEDQAARSARREQDPARFDARRQTLARERDLRIAELRAKGTLSIRMRLLNVLVVHQPKLLVSVTVSGGKLQPSLLDVTWDPLVEQLEAPSCPSCSSSTYELAVHRGQLACPACQTAPSTSGNKGNHRRDHPRR